MVRLQALFQLAVTLIIFVVSYSIALEATELIQEGTDYSENNATISTRKSKVFPFIAVVSFPNTRCVDAATGTSGLCYTSKQCTRNGGTVTASPCAQGYGVCCTFVRSCSGTPPTLTVSQNLTKITGVGNSPATQPCQIKIPKKAGVCQLRLNFTRFEVGGAGLDGNCALDNVVTFTGANLPDGLSLCGVNTGQHLYLHYGQMDTITINTNLANAASVYDIDIAMIRCDSMERAPDGCSQYFTAGSGQVTSFNYPTQQLNSERYSVCVRGAIDQSVTWVPCANPVLPATNSFFVTGNRDDAASLVPGTGTQCTYDYVLIPPSNRMCGYGFPQQGVRSTMPPFIMYVNFDDSEVPELNGPIDPRTGCPVGSDCVKEDGSVNVDPPCVESLINGQCVVQGFLIDLIDIGNTGFCFTYSVA